MYKIEFTLKQHTPLIHFQHDQAGATLRATEVKPKLDRFIIEKLTGRTGEDAFNNFKANPEWKKWLVGNGEHPALDYKIKVEKPKSAQIYLPLELNPNNNKEPNKGNKLVTYIKENLNIDVVLIAPSPYFANSDKYKFRNGEIDRNSTNLSELRFAIKSDDPLKICFTGWNNDLLKEIEKSSPAFFLLNNFGTRQSKGFGSFMPIGLSTPSKELLNLMPESIGLEAIYLKDFKSFDVQKIFTEISNIWKVLKAGNSYGKYEKSDIFNYFYNLPTPIRWEKRAIKKNLKVNYPSVFKELKYDIKNSKYNRILSESDSQENHFFIRALLGLAENNEYGAFKFADKIKIQVSDSLTNNNRTKEKAIDRFRSPITFKIIEDRIYMLVYKINSQLQVDVDGNDRSFDFVLNSQVNGVSFNGNLINLKIPKEFSVMTFLDSEKYSTSTGKRTGTSVAKSYGFNKL
jgi:hypothetical protein